MPEEQSPTATGYRRRAIELRLLARQLTLLDARNDTLAEAAKWDRLAELAEKADKQPRKP